MGSALPSSRFRGVLRRRLTPRVGGGEVVGVAGHALGVGDLARVRRAYAMDYEMFEAIGLDATATSAAPRDGAAWADSAAHSRVTHEGRFTTWTGLDRMKNRPPDLEEKSLRQLMLEAKEKDASKPPEAKSSGGPGSGGLRSRKNRDARRRRYRGRRA